LGLKVSQSNLCVTGETELLTDEGYLPIGALVDQEVAVWNGTEFSNVVVQQTGSDQELVRVWFSDGGYLDCTPYHKFYLEGSSDKATRAIDLRDGDVLDRGVQAFEVGGTLTPSRDKEDIVAYVAGWTTFHGFEDANRLATYVPNESTARWRMTQVSVDMEADEDGFTIRYEPKTIPAGFVPSAWNLHRRLHWLAGALDCAGAWLDVDGERSLVIGHTDADLIREMRLLGLVSSLRPKMLLTDTMNVLMISEYDAWRLREAGFLTRDNVRETVVRPLQPIFVVDVHPLPYTADTFCASEPLRGRLTFNGYVTGNCTEIMLHSGPDHLGKDRTAVCCLSSVNAEFFDDWKDDPNFIEDLMRMLDNALQTFIDNAPPQMSKAAYSAMMERSVGLGLFGFHSLLKYHNLPFDSIEARRINSKLFKHLRRKADAASLVLGAERGSPPDMEGTGERFAHKLALAPNASSSIISVARHRSGTSPSTEPDPANAFLHKTLSGSFPVRNPYLEIVLERYGKNDEETWKSIVGNEGSVQHLDFLSEHEKWVHRTAREIPQMAIVLLAGDRSDDICQGQSVNLFFDNSADAELLSEVHYTAWELGVKSLYYFRATTEKRAENVATKIERRIVDVAPANEDRPIEDDVCFSCQG
jgi:ribonucleotide reductase alpha subunit